ncbi:MAG: hypothetical protein LBN32_00585 [Helicobacteraceae bacterium]|jgi:uncharacterized integral membrane protein/biotin operon repressor|nr:hypothetical protein [Helicobacteraceae bacterium]
MKLNSFSTPLIIGIFVIVFISGVLMFFHVKTAPLVALHEWFGIGFAAAALLHLINHKKPTVQHFKRPLAIALICAAIASGALFYALAPKKGSNYAKMIVERTYQAPIAVSVGIFGLEFDEAIDKLRLNGIAIESDQDTIKTVAQKHGISPDRVVEALLSQSPLQQK